MAKIKVIGVGGGGSNAIDRMISHGGISGVEFVAINTDAQALLYNRATIKVQIGDEVTRGLGSGSDPGTGQKAATESESKLKEELVGADLVFITAGMGGGTGTGASPTVARIARECGALTVAVVTKPFLFEGSKRATAARQGIEELRKHVDTLIVVPNQKVLQIIDQKTSMLEAFEKINSVLFQGVSGIAELITEPGLINVDFADVRTIMKESGNALMGIGVASGDGRAQKAVSQAVSSPLLDSTINGAKGVLINISGGSDMTMLEVDEAAHLIAQSVDPDAEIIFGASINPQLKDHIKVTLIATRYDTGYKMQPLSAMPPKPQPMPIHDHKETVMRPVNIDPKDLEDEDPYEVPAFLRRR